MGYYDLSLLGNSPLPTTLYPLLVGSERMSDRPTYRPTNPVAAEISTCRGSRGTTRRRYPTGGMYYVRIDCVLPVKMIIVQAMRGLAAPGRCASPSEALIDPTSQVPQDKLAALGRFRETPLFKGVNQGQVRPGTTSRAGPRNRRQNMPNGYTRGMT
jgi:hypothetical protein